MEAVERRDDLVAPLRLADEPGHLDRGLVRLGARVAEEDLAVVDAALVDERLGEQALRLHVPGVRHVDQPGDLLRDRLHDPRRTVAEEAAAPAGEEVEILRPLAVPDVRALATDEADRRPAVVADHVAVEQSDRFLQLHGRIRQRMIWARSWCSKA